MPSLPDDGPPRLARRSFLAGTLRVATAGLAVPGLAGGSGCAPPEKEAEILRVDVSGLVPGERLVVDQADYPVEFLRTVDGISARSLLCTHQGCVVRWIEFENEYLCPCHDARFDEHGVPKYGPAKRPLRQLPVKIIGDEAHVDLRAPEA